MTWRSGAVVAVGPGWPGALELTVEVAQPDADAPLEPVRVKALAYPAIVGEPRVGDRVLLNVTALDRGLGTGGYALVVALPDRLPVDLPGRGGWADAALPAGHLVKARYTPLQVMVLGADEQESPHHQVLREADDVGGMPVVVADLHSSLPAILAGLLAERPSARAAYVMTDGGALPAWFSRTLAGLRAARLAGRLGHRGAGLRRRPGGCDAAQRAARGPPRAGRGRRGRHPGPGQPGHGHPLGLLRGRGR